MKIDQSGDEVGPYTQDGTMVRRNGTERTVEDVEGFDVEDPNPTPSDWDDFFAVAAVVEVADAASDDSPPASSPDDLIPFADDIVTGTDDAREMLPWSCVGGLHGPRISAGARASETAPSLPTLDALLPPRPEQSHTTLDGAMLDGAGGILSDEEMRALLEYLKDDGFLNGDHHTVDEQYAAYLRALDELKAYIRETGDSLPFFVAGYGAGGPCIVYRDSFEENMSPKLRERLEDAGIRIRRVGWEYIGLNPLCTGHVAIEITLPGGQIMYADAGCSGVLQGNQGGGDYIFWDVPPTMVKPGYSGETRWESIWGTIGDLFEDFRVPDPSILPH